MNTINYAAYPPPPGIPPLASLVRAEHIPTLANVPEEKKATYVQGVSQLWEQIRSKPPDSADYQNAFKKLHEVSQSLRKHMSQHMSQVRAAQTAQNGARPGSQGQPQPETRPNAPQPGQPSSGQAQEHFSQKVIENIRKQVFVAPPDIVAQGQEQSAAWLRESKHRYAVFLQKYETSQLKLQELNVLQHNKNKDGRSISPQDAQQLQSYRTTYEKVNQQAREYLTKFKVQQDSIKAMQKQGEASTAAATDTATGQPPVAPSAESAPNVAEPQVSNPVTTTNTVSDHQGQPHTVSSALDAARNHSNSLSGNMGPGNQGSVNQPVNTQAPDNQATTGNSQSRPPVTSANGAPPQPYHSSQTTTANPTTNMPQGPHPLSHQAAITQSAEKYSQHPYPSSASQAATTHAHPQMSGRDPQNNNHKMPIPKELRIPQPQPVAMGPARPTLTGGPSSGAMGPLGQPAIQKHPQYVLQGDGERVLGRNKLLELVRQVTGGADGEEGETLSAAAEETLLDVADDFVDQVITAACKLAKLRTSQTLELRDVQLVLERNYNIRIPGYASDELRTVKKVQPTPAWTQKLSAIQAAKVTGGKPDI
ncbi:MAG: hypothetical protein Q9220_002123 [cf. Caloplaca sp. 1 TL-2023]